MTRSSKLSLALLTAVVAATGFAAPTASADTRSVNVEISDLDLNTEYGAATFATRVESATAKVCARSGDRSYQSLQERRLNVRNYEQCRIDAAEGITSQIPDAPIALAAVSEQFPDADIQSGPVMMMADAAAGSSTSGL